MMAKKGFKSSTMLVALFAERQKIRHCIIYFLTRAGEKNHKHLTGAIVAK